MMKVLPRQVKGDFNECKYLPYAFNFFNCNTVNIGLIFVGWVRYNLVFIYAIKSVQREYFVVSRNSFVLKFMCLVDIFL